MGKKSRQSFRISLGNSPTIEKYKFARNLRESNWIILGIHTPGSFSYRTYRRKDLVDHACSNQSNGFSSGEECVQRTPSGPRVRQANPILRNFGWIRTGIPNCFRGQTLTINVSEIL